MFCAIAFVFLFIFFLVRLLPKENIASYRPIRRV
jgi:flagellar biogenesis protein FliO